MRTAATLALVSILVSLPVFGGFAAQNVLIPAAGRISGAGGSEFYTDVWLHNAGSADATVTFQLLVSGQSNPSPLTVTRNIARGSDLPLKNATESLFGVTGTLGAIRVTSDQPVAMNARVFNRTGGATLGETEGMAISGVPADFGAAAGQIALLQGAVNNADFRYNIFVVESAGQPAAFTLRVRNDAGQIVRETPYQFLGYEQRIIPLSSLLAQPQFENGTIEIEVSSGAGRIIAMGSQVANVSQDGTTFEMTFPQSLLSAGVTSLNGLTGALKIQGNGVTSVTQSGDTITITTTGNNARAGAGLTAAISGQTTTLAIATGGVVNSMIAAGAVTDDKIASVSYAKITGAPSSSSPSGPAGGALAGTYPNPTIAAGAVGDANITSLSFAKITGAPTTLPPSGPAGGGLTGAYPNPTIAPNAVADANITNVSYAKVTGAPATLPPSGPAGGALTGTYPNPTIAPNAVADANITNVAYAKVTGAPASLPPSGAAGGSLTGTYPNPTFALNTVGAGQLTTGAVTPVKIDSTGAVAGQAITYNGAAVVWGTATATLALPFSGTVNSNPAAFAVTNTGSGNAISASISNATSSANVLNVQTNGIGPGIIINLTNATNGARGLDVLNAGFGPGVYASANGNGIWGVTPNISSAGAIGDNSQGEAVVGRCCSGRPGPPPNDANGIGSVVGRNDGLNGYGVRGFCTKQPCIGVLGQAGISGSTGSAGRFDNVNGSNTSPALLATTNAAGGLAFQANGNSQMNGNLNVTGTVSKGGGSFKIDHPLDPENKYLYHSFVESPDMMNIYNGVITVDANGRAVVELPEWFTALNRDYRYQLTAIGEASPNLHIAKKIANNRFEIAGAAPNIEISWQVTGIRQDAFANAHRIPVEQAKEAQNQGKYLYPIELGHTEADAISEKPIATTESVENRLELPSSQPAGTPRQ